MRKTVLVTAIFLLFGFLSGCTQPGETTGVSSATGGVLGAGLGAIIGSQTGDPGAGLVIGAAAGSGTGALIGNAIESQHVAIRSQDEALERQEQVIRAQAAEIEELRRLSQDSIDYSPSADPKASFKAPNQVAGFAGENPVGNAGRRRIQESSLIIPDSIKSRPEPALRVPQDSMKEATLAPSDSQISNSQTAAFKPKRMRFGQEAVQPTMKEVEPVRQKIETNKKLSEQTIDNVSEVQAPVVAQETEIVERVVEKPQNRMPSKVARATVTSNAKLSPDCQDAEKEVRKAKTVTDAADKLFHYRRALRLCPHQSSHHTGLGEVYESLGRMEDARFEYQEALKLNPNYSPAQANLKQLNSLDGAVG